MLVTLACQGGKIAKSAHVAVARNLPQRVRALVVRNKLTISRAPCSLRRDPCSYRPTQGPQPLASPASSCDRLSRTGPLNLPYWKASHDDGVRSPGGRRRGGVSFRRASSCDWPNRVGAHERRCRPRCPLSASQLVRPLKPGPSYRPTGNPCTPAPSERKTTGQPGVYSDSTGEGVYRA